MKKVLLINYNRPEKTAKSVEPVLREAEELFLFCDGPKKNPEKTAEVQDLLKNIKLEREKRRLKTELRFLEKNLGSRMGPTDAIKWFFSKVDQGTIIEDDIVVSKNLLSFHENLLKEQADSNYLWIGGGFPLPKAKTAVIASKTSQLIAWSTWREKALPAIEASLSKTTPWSMKKMQLLKGLNPKTQVFLWKEFQKLEKNLEWSWAYRWLQYQLDKKMLTLTPTARMHTNIGYDGSGHNCFNVFGVGEDASPESDISKTLSKPSIPSKDPKSEQLREWKYYGRVHQLVGRKLYGITPHKFKHLWRPVK
jgi:hypothetical protein